jgi:cobalt/nickel transport system ATP-binding protein
MNGIPSQSAVAEPAVAVEAMSYAYSKGLTALQGVSFTVRPGESVGLVGPNGAGKTTLFLCLAGVLGVKAGMARLAGLDPANPEERRQLPAKVGVVFQNSDDQLFQATVIDDVAFGPLNLGLDIDETRRRVTAALREVGLAGMEQRVPYHLSGGEKRRVAVAGVLAMQPGILLLDEPSMYLDPRGRRDLIHLINRLPVTKIIASHDLEMIRETCTRILMLDAGCLVAEGPVREILANAALMNAHGLEVPHSLTHHTATDRHHH